MSINVSKYCNVVKTNYYQYFSKLTCIARAHIIFKVCKYLIVTMFYVGMSNTLYF